MSHTARSLIDDTPDLYDNAFALLALATARDVLGGAAVDSHIDSLLAALDAHMARPDSGGYSEYLPAPAWRLQNPHMHLFESLLALYATRRDATTRERVATLYAFIESRFFNDEQSCVNEVGDPADDSQTGYFEPGHSMEWVWLLGWHARLFDVAYPDFGRKLYGRALDTLDDTGRAVMRVDFSGNARDASRRLWSQTETLKAHLCMMEFSAGEASSRAAERAAQCGDGLFDEWLTPAVSGGWLDHFDAGGRLISSTMPASSGYHLYCAIAELARLA